MIFWSMWRAAAIGLWACSVALPQDGAAFCPKHCAVLSRGRRRTLMALDSGAMMFPGLSRTSGERRALAEYLAARPIGRESLMGDAVQGQPLRGASRELLQSAQQPALERLGRRPLGQPLSERGHGGPRRREGAAAQMGLRLPERHRRLSGDKSHCPEASGHDFDFGPSPILVELLGEKRALVAGQKSSIVHAVDPERRARFFGRYVSAAASPVAADRERGYVAVSDVISRPAAAGSSRCGHHRREAVAQPGDRL